MKTESQARLQTEQQVPGAFIYENEHPQLQVPFSAHIGDRRMEGTSLSVTNARVSGLLGPGAHWRKRHIILTFDFEGFSVNLFVVADIWKVGEDDTAEFELVFCDPTGSHLAPLRYILNSHLAGDLVTVGRFMEYAGPTDVKEKSAAPKRSFATRVRDTLRGTVLIGLSVGLVVLAANVVVDRFAFRYEPRPVVIAQDGDTLRATAAGQITYVNGDANAGDVIYSIGSNSGTLLSVQMPCECEISPLSDFYEGATVLAGTPLVQLIATDAAPHAKVDITYEGVARLLAGDAPELEFPDGRIIPVNLSLTDTSEAQPGRDFVTADLRISDSNATPLDLGETARLRFRRDVVPSGMTRLWTDIFGT
ncbi:hypothetical protein [Yoonia sp. 2307UL14-13]|uniref:hypothetical protein n=1 Tax=Yoonia sp. 2307UL14-13 TaxID=3126506 RepID=UPI00309555C6